MNNRPIEAQLAGDAGMTAIHGFALQNGIETFSASDYATLAKVLPHQAMQMLERANKMRLALGGPPTPTPPAPTPPPISVAVAPPPAAALSAVPSFVSVAPAPGTHAPSPVQALPTRQRTPQQMQPSFERVDVTPNMSQLAGARMIPDALMQQNQQWGAGASRQAQQQQMVPQYAHQLQQNALYQQQGGHAMQAQMQEQQRRHLLMQQQQHAEEERRRLAQEHLQRQILYAQHQDKARREHQANQLQHAAALRAHENERLRQSRLQQLMMGNPLHQIPAGAQGSFFQQHQQPQFQYMEGNGMGGFMYPPTSVPVMQPFTPPEEVEEEDDFDDAVDDVSYTNYEPKKLGYGLPHPDAVVENSSMAAVLPPDVWYKPSLLSLTGSANVLTSGKLSALQLEAVVYASQRHESRLRTGERAGFFLGDGAGVGKGRQLAALILENALRGRRRHVWISVGNDLAFDARRDLDDIGAGKRQDSGTGGRYVPSFPLHKLGYGPIPHKAGVCFATYQIIVAKSGTGRQSRLEQLIKWCGPKFDGCILFDECHRAKNLFTGSQGTSTKAALSVVELQARLPNARIVYCSATGASEPRNLGYMTRLGLWGPGSPFPDGVDQFMKAVDKRGVGAMEMVAMHLKQMGAFLCRTLSFHGCEFELVSEVAGEEVEAKTRAQYDAAAAYWQKLRRIVIAATNERSQLPDSEAASQSSGDEYSDEEDDFLEAVENDGGKKKQKRGTDVWRYFWGAHQRFFRDLCIASKVPSCLVIARAALESGHCVVIGLQSTGEAGMMEKLGTKSNAASGATLPDLISAPRQTLERVLKKCLPLPRRPRSVREREAEEAEAKRKLDEEEEMAAMAKEHEDWMAAMDAAKEDGDEEEAEFGPVEPKSKKAQNGGGKFIPSGATLHAGRRFRKREAVINYKEPDSDDDAFDPTLPPKKKKKGDKTKSGGGSSSTAAAGGAPSKKIVVKSEVKSEAVPVKKLVKVKSEPKKLKKKKPASDDEEEDDDDASESSSKDGGDSDSDSVASGGKESGKEEEGDEETEEEKAAAAALMEQREKRYMEAKAQIDELLAEADALCLPGNPLDQIINELGGPTKVAEMTGRKGRLVRVDSGPDGGTAVRYQLRSANGVSLEMQNIHERDAFMKAEKFVAIISEAASAGISLQADRRAVNQRRRVHITLELPWSADRAVQQLGRSHRSNQSSAPLYRLLLSDVGGERRFASAVARRLESLGALTQGDRRASAGSLSPGLASFNVDTRYGRQALEMLYAEASGRPLGFGKKAVTVELPPIPEGELEESASLLAELAEERRFRHHRSKGDDHGNLVTTWLREVGIDLEDTGKNLKAATTVARFLNRMLGLQMRRQSYLFKRFQDLLSAIVQRARSDGDYDEGISEIKGRTITFQGELKVVHKTHLSRVAPSTLATDEEREALAAAEVTIPTLQLDVVADRGVPFSLARHLLEQAESASALEIEAREKAAKEREKHAEKKGTKGGKPKKIIPPINGFYISKRAFPGLGGNKKRVLLAVEKGASAPTGRVRIFRPQTGANDYDRRRLDDAYEKIGLEGAQSHWDADYDAAGSDTSKGPRFQRYMILCGGVLPVWHRVEEVLSSPSLHLKESDRLLRIVCAQEKADPKAAVCAKCAAKEKVKENENKPIDVGKIVEKKDAKEASGSKSKTDVVNIDVEVDGEKEQELDVDKVDVKSNGESSKAERAVDVDVVDSEKAQTSSSIKDTTSVEKDETVQEVSNTTEKEGTSSEAKDSSIEKGDGGRARSKSPPRSKSAGKASAASTPVKSSSDKDKSVLESPAGNVVPRSHKCTTCGEVLEEEKGDSMLVDDEEKPPPKMVVGLLVPQKAAEAVAKSLAEWVEEEPEVPKEEVQEENGADAAEESDDEDDEGCVICGVDENPRDTLLCDKCDREFHTYCCDPPITEIPEGDWFCQGCTSLGAGKDSGGADEGGGAKSEEEEEEQEEKKKPSPKKKSIVSKKDREAVLGLLNSDSEPDAEDNDMEDESDSAQSSNGDRGGKKRKALEKSADSGGESSVPSPKKLKKIKPLAELSAKDEPKEAVVKKEPKSRR